MSWLFFLVCTISGFAISSRMLCLCKKLLVSSAELCKAIVCFTWQPCLRDKAKNENAFALKLRCAQTTKCCSFEEGRVGNFICCFQIVSLRSGNIISRVATGIRRHTVHWCWHSEQAGILAGETAESFNWSFYAFFLCNTRSQIHSKWTGQCQKGQTHSCSFRKCGLCSFSCLLRWHFRCNYFLNKRNSRSTTLSYICCIFCRVTT